MNHQCLFSSINSQSYVVSNVIKDSDRLKCEVEMETKAKYNRSPMLLHQ